MSGGQQQRVGVARALAADPELLLMDEPFGALDPITRAALQQEMARIHQGSGKTIVLVTHDIEEALRLATRIVLLDRGRVVQDGPPAQLLEQPANDFVREFFGRTELGLRLLALHRVGERVRAGEAGRGRAGRRGDELARRAVAVRAAPRRSAAGGRCVGPCTRRDPFRRPAVAAFAVTA